MSLTHESLWLKSKMMMDRALTARDQGRREEFYLWTALVLELLGKARLAKLHPALVADPQHADTMLAVCGGPSSLDLRSIAAKTVFLRLQKTVLGFDQVCHDFCARLAEDRNSYLHSGGMPFAGARPDNWHSKCWAVISLILTAQSRTLEDFVGTQEAAAARAVIEDAARHREVTIQRRIASHLEAFDALTFTEKHLRGTAAKLLERQIDQDAETTQKTHECPACHHLGILDGDTLDESEGEPVENEPWNQWFTCTIETESFRCPSCGLKLEGVDEIAAADLPSEYERDILRQVEYGDPYGND